MIIPDVGSKPVPEISKSLPAAHICTARILPSVRVPVLSEQMTEAEPRVSTAAMRRTRTFWLTIVEQPEESEIVTHSGMPSGIAATVRVMATRSMYSGPGISKLLGFLVFNDTPTMKTITQTKIAKTPMIMPKRCKEACRGVMPEVVSGIQPPHQPTLVVPANS